MVFIAKILKKIFAIRSPSKEWMNVSNTHCTISCNGNFMIDDESCIYCDVYCIRKSRI